MTQASNASAITLVMGNQIETVRTSALHHLRSSQTHHQLVVIDEQNQPQIYILDIATFEGEYVESYGTDENEMTQLALISSALFRHLLKGGLTFKVLGKGKGIAESLVTE
jgi:hypothetical protein